MITLANTDKDIHTLRRKSDAQRKETGVRQLLKKSCAPDDEGVRLQTYAASVIQPFRVFGSLLS
jgi:hypothetical protein